MYGFGSMTSHGARCAASTFSPCRSVHSSTRLPAVSRQLPEQRDPGTGEPRVDPVRGAGGGVLPLELISPCGAHLRERAERVGRVRLRPQPPQQPGHDLVLFRLGQHLAQRGAGPAPFDQQRVRRVGLVSVVQPDGPVPVPDPQPCRLVPLLAAGEPESDLEHQAGTGRVGHRRGPRALPARLERLTHPQRPPVREAGHELRQAGEPGAHALIAACRLAPGTAAR